MPRPGARLRSRKRRGKGSSDAQAYEITQINNAIARNPAYIQLQSLEALKAISKDPASKVYFMDGSSPSPLPLMHIGDPPSAQR